MLLELGLQTKEISGKNSLNISAAHFNHFTNIYLALHEPPKTCDLTQNVQIMKYCEVVNLCLRPKRDYLDSKLQSRYVTH